MDAIDPRIYRTELLAPGPYGQPAWRWALFIDGDPVADTDPGLSNDQAKDWARRTLGEGVTFEHVVGDEHYHPDRTCDWVASPSQR